MNGVHNFAWFRREAAEQSEGALQYTGRRRDVL